MDRRVTSPTLGSPPPCKQALNHTNNRGVQAVALICNSCFAALKLSLSFQLLSVNYLQKLNWSSYIDKFSLHCTLPQHAAFFSI